MKKIQEEAKKRFPIGCYYKPVRRGGGFGEKIKLRADSYVYKIVQDTIYAHDCAGCLYLDGVWAELCDENGKTIGISTEPQYEIY